MLLGKEMEKQYYIKIVQNIEKQIEKRITQLLTKSIESIERFGLNNSSKIISENLCEISSYMDDQRTLKSIDWFSDNLKDNIDSINLHNMYGLREIL
jgi:Uri superfamily endonuclease